ncbi:MAG: alanine racemase [Nitrospiraceae bacterium]|nr:alanine racemase [Nitrospiraceae bacterium]
MKPRDPTPQTIPDPGYPEGRTRVTVDLDQLLRNVRKVIHRLGKNEGLLPVIKANAYGHGLLPVMTALSSIGINQVAVMGTDEALSLRRGRYSGAIILLGGFSGKELALCFREKLTPVLHHWDQIRLLEAFSPAREPLDLHLKIDSGMGRLGFLPPEIPQVLDRMLRIPHGRITGVMTHFPLSEDRKDTEGCLELFQECVLSSLSHPALSSLSVIHMANSGGVMQGLVSFPTPRSSGKSLTFWARPGLMLYGHLPVSDLPGWEEISPVLTVEARLLSLRNLPKGHSVSYGRTEVLSRDSRLGILGVGYADGLPRALSGRGWGVIDGRKVPFAGRVCMDMVEVDLTDLPRPVEIGEWVSIIDPRESESMTVDQIARWTGTIPYEVLCLLGHRADRRFVGDASRFLQNDF